MRVLGNLALADFENRLRLALAAGYADRMAMFPDGGLTFIKRAIASARSSGLRMEADIARWAEILLVQGEDFGTSEATKWAQPLLADSTASPEERLSRIDAWLRAAEVHHTLSKAAVHGE